ncbi:MAG TPA: alcohol dehydrogenase [Acidiphilium sp.]|uniref:alcohol dehydrogenase n=1 Tax=unclassified Acidiphilium TaxID=2617493 RepID=UPI000BDD967A|nr:MULTISPECIES: alcohol dehydrogenase [unclassified Acidiphilium]OYV57359.1 MAG: alcohol dehydrogenase [Acidiphilium sp. 20-67-58]HQT60496.1 alcohol dehydrogenase [Acidiphilium sp.]HQU10467.1 alcohol dehydrogenase [Acidiphilium sp.]
MSTTMKAWAVVENGAPLKEIDLPMPEPKGQEILLEVTHCGVCHSDLHLWDGYYDLGSAGRYEIVQRGITLPLALGHEIVGRVVKLGPEASGAKVGDVRIVYPWVGCGECARCKAGEDNLCAKQRSLGIYQHGGYATHVIAAHAGHLVDPGDLDPALAATYACSGITVYAAIRKVMPLPADTPVVLIGAGGLGLSAIAVLRALGHRAIVSVDTSATKRAAALAAGASAVVDGNDPALHKAIIAACGGQPEAIIDLVNGSGTAKAAHAALAKGGKLIMVGLFGGELNIPLPFMPMRALTLQGSFVGTPGDLRELVDLAQGGALPKLQIETVPQREADAAIHRLKAGEVTGRLVLVAEGA